jgi:hypothetical protein
VLSTKEAIKIIKKKIGDREKFEKFAAKFGENSGLFSKEFKVPGTSYSSFKDLV